MIALAASACGSDTTSGGSNSGGDADPKTLTVWQMGAGSPEQTKFLDGVEEEFKKKHPGTDVVVKYIPWPQVATTFQKAASGGEGPDVTEVGNTDVQSHIEQGNLADISDKLKAWDEGKDLNTGALANDQADGKTYAVPWYGGVRGVWYRKDWFTELGITPPKTWDELRAAAKKIQDAKGVPGIAAPSDQTNAILSFVWANGGDVAVKEGGKWVGKLDQPAAREAIDFYAGLVAKDKVAPDKYVGKNELQGPQQDFALGTLGMYIDGSWALPQMQKVKDDLANWGTFPIPGKSGGTAPVFSGGSDLAVWKSSKAQGVAFDYITVLNSKKNAQAFADTLKFLPQFTDVLKSSKYTDDPLMSAFAAASAGGVKFTPTSKGWAEFEQAKKVIPNTVKEIMQGKSAEDELKKANEQANTLLNAA
ncbi:MAG TPA: extracellular solute-binding protein [Actinokineospora sp.]|jgi:N,N'-diacetylchitobiose transport system substrate-binding protein|nr:extracellular solute-binding protein [Actinokineospora sp.]